LRRYLSWLMHAANTELSQILVASTHYRLGLQSDAPLVGRAVAAPTEAELPAADVNTRAAKPGIRATLEHIAPALALFFLAPLVGGFLLGNMAIDALPCSHWPRCTAGRRCSCAR
jgi:hypothetical protein